jgi:hypothetical protein
MDDKVTCAWRSKRATLPVPAGWGVWRERHLCSVRCLKMQVAYEDAWPTIGEVEWQGEST